VDKPDPDTTASDQDKAQEAACGLVVSGGDAALFLEMADEAFDA
jgi:pyruvate-formate lyase-activating enzyme